MAFSMGWASSADSASVQTQAAGTANGSARTWMTKSPATSSSR